MVSWPRTVWRSAESAESSARCRSMATCVACDQLVRHGEAWTMRWRNRGTVAASRASAVCRSAVVGVRSRFSRKTIETLT
ncbi:hypothetical protein BJF85_23985 [Saccharomonospora sp. CUA-673]|nr:hypothetical protein BJF85_23985 [Saccharomonospora sp. CUA-673]